MAGKSKIHSKYYVYFHIDPISKEIVYVGEGSGGRAWQCSKTNRHDKDHYGWICNLLESGFTPQDFVVVIQKNMTLADARKCETEYIKRIAPKFNAWGEVYRGSLTPEQIKQCKDLKERGLTYSEIAAQIGKSNMTVWRAINQEWTLFGPRDLDGKKDKK